MKVYELINRLKDLPAGMDILVEDVTAQVAGTKLLDTVVSEGADATGTVTLHISVELE